MFKQKSITISGFPFLSPALYLFVYELEGQNSPTYCPNFQSWIYVLIPLLVLPLYWWWIMYLKSNWKNWNLSFRYLIHHYNQSPLLPFHHHNVCKRILEENKKDRFDFCKKTCVCLVCVLHNIIISSIMLDNCIRAFGFYLSYKNECWQFRKKKTGFFEFPLLNVQKDGKWIEHPMGCPCHLPFKIWKFFNYPTICYYVPLEYECW